EARSAHTSRDRGSRAGHRRRPATIHTSRDCDTAARAVRRRLTDAAGGFFGGRSSRLRSCSRPSRSGTRAMSLTYGHAGAAQAGRGALPLAASSGLGGLRWGGRGLCGGGGGLRWPPLYPWLATAIHEPHFLGLTCADKPADVAVAHAVPIKELPPEAAPL